jgi:hypothetical protein
VQFVSLLVHRRVTGDNGGWVTLEDLASLAAFRKLSPNAIGKYLVNRSAELTPLTMRFLRRYVNLTTTGPYTLYLNPDRIIVERPRLENYLRIIGSSPVTEKSSSILLWQEGEQNFRDSDLLSSHRLFEAFARIVKPSEPDYHSLMTVACLRLAEIEYQGQFGNRDIAYLFAKATDHTNQITDRRKWELFTAYILGMRAFMSYPKRQTAGRIARLDQDAIKLIDKLPDTPDKLCLLGGRHYHLYYLALRYGMKDVGKDELKASVECFKQVELGGLPKWVHYDNGIMEGVQLQSTLIHKSQVAEPIGEDDLAQYDSLVHDGKTNRVIALTCAEWMRYVMVKARDLDRALEFSTKCLLENATLHETSIFRRILADNHRLKESVK